MSVISSFISMITFIVWLSSNCTILTSHLLPTPLDHGLLTLLDSDFEKDDTTITPRKKKK